MSGPKSTVAAYELQHEVIDMDNLDAYLGAEAWEVKLEKEQDLDLSFEMDRTGDMVVPSSTELDATILVIHLAVEKGIDVLAWLMDGVSAEESYGSTTQIQIDDEPVPVDNSNLISAKQFTSRLSSLALVVSVHESADTRAEVDLGVSDEAMDIIFDFFGQEQEREQEQGQGQGKDKAKAKNKNKNSPKKSPSKKKSYFDEPDSDSDSDGDGDGEDDGRLVVDARLFLVFCYERMETVELEFNARLAGEQQLHAAASVAIAHNAAYANKSNIDSTEGAPYHHNSFKGRADQHMHEGGNGHGNGNGNGNGSNISPHHSPQAASSRHTSAGKCSPSPYTNRTNRAGRGRDGYDDNHSASSGVGGEFVNSPTSIITSTQIPQSPFDEAVDFLFDEEDEDEDQEKDEDETLGSDGLPLSAYRGGSGGGRKGSLRGKFKSRGGRAGGLTKGDQSKETRKSRGTSSTNLDRLYYGTKNGTTTTNTKKKVSSLSTSASPSAGAGARLSEAEGCDLEALYRSFDVVEDLIRSRIVRRPDAFLKAKIRLGLHAPVSSKLGPARTALLKPVTQGRLTVREVQSGFLAGNLRLNGEQTDVLFALVKSFEAHVREVEAIKKVEAETAAEMAAQALALASASTRKDRLAGSITGNGSPRSPSSQSPSPRERDRDRDRDSPFTTQNIKDLTLVVDTSSKHTRSSASPHDSPRNVNRRGGPVSPHHNHATGESTHTSVSVSAPSNTKENHVHAASTAAINIKGLPGPKEVPLQKAIGKKGLHIEWLGLYLRYLKTHRKVASLQSLSLQSLQRQLEADRKKEKEKENNDNVNEIEAKSSPHSTSHNNNTSHSHSPSASASASADGKSTSSGLSPPVIINDFPLPLPLPLPLAKAISGEACRSYLGVSDGELDLVVGRHGVELLGGHALNTEVAIRLRRWVEDVDGCGDYGKRLRMQLSLMERAFNNNNNNNNSNKVKKVNTSHSGSDRARTRSPSPDLPQGPAQGGNSITITNVNRQQKNSKKEASERRTEESERRTKEIHAQHAKERKIQEIHKQRIGDAKTALLDAKREEILSSERLSGALSRELFWKYIAYCRESPDALPYVTTTTFTDIYAGKEYEDAFIPPPPVPVPVVIGAAASSSSPSDKFKFKSSSSVASSVGGTDKSKAKAKAKKQQQQDMGVGALVCSWEEWLQWRQERLHHTIADVRDSRIRASARLRESLQKQQSLHQQAVISALLQGENVNRQHVYALSESVLIGDRDKLSNTGNSKTNDINTPHSGAGVGAGWLAASLGAGAKDGTLLMGTQVSSHGSSHSHASSAFTSTGSTLYSVGVALDSLGLNPNKAPSIPGSTNVAFGGGTSRVSDAATRRREKEEHEQLVQHQEVLRKSVLSFAGETTRSVTLPSLSFKPDSPNPTYSNPSTFSGVQANNLLGEPVPESEEEQAKREKAETVKQKYEEWAALKRVKEKERVEAEAAAARKEKFAVAKKKREAQRSYSRWERLRAQNKFAFKTKSGRVIIKKHPFLAHQFALNTNTNTNGGEDNEIDEDENGDDDDDNETADGSIVGSDAHTQEEKNRKRAVVVECLVHPKLQVPHTQAWNSYSKHVLGEGGKMLLPSEREVHKSKNKNKNTVKSSDNVNSLSLSSSSSSSKDKTKTKIIAKTKTKKVKRKRSRD